MILVDKRVGGETRYILAEEGESLMLIPDEMRKCVAYVGYKMANGSERLCGSAFFVMRPKAVDMMLDPFWYVVTARHVISGIRKKGLDRVILRVNGIDGNAHPIEMKLSRWKVHDDDSVDVAASKIDMSPLFDHSPWGVGHFAVPDVVHQERVGIGEEVCVVGLFRHAYGKTKNIPIVRFGNIAAMPDEPITTKMGQMTAYLVESRSVSGLSGSPVFVNVGEQERGRYIKKSSKFLFLGLTHGHFDVDDFKIDTTEDGRRENASVNAGIAIVVPAERVLEVINKFDDEEKPVVEAESRKRMPAMDSVDIPTNPSITKEGFEAALKKASRKIAHGNTK